MCETLANAPPWVATPYEDILRYYLLVQGELRGRPLGCLYFRSRVWRTILLADPADDKPVWPRTDGRAARAEEFAYLAWLKDDLTFIQTSRGDLCRNVGCHAVFIHVLEPTEAWHFVLDIPRWNQPLGEVYDGIARSTPPLFPRLGYLDHGGIMYCYLGGRVVGDREVIKMILARMYPGAKIREFQQVPGTGEFWG